MAIKTLTAHGSAQIDTGQFKVGSASGQFAATSDYVSIPDDTDWAFGSGDFTWEMWVRTPASPSGYTTPMTQVEAGGAYMGFNMHFSGSDNLIWACSPELNFSCSKTWSANTWYHIAVCRSGSTWYLFIDGVAQTKSLAYGSYSATLTDLAASMYIGQNPYGFFGNNFTGWIDEVRIQKGEALYTSNFTPPTSPLTENAYTVLLCHFEGSDGSTTFTDSSVSSTAYETTLTETVSIIDNCLKQGQKTITEVFTIVDTVFKNIAHITVETITIVDTILKQENRILSEVVNVIDNIKKSSSRILNDTISLADTILKQGQKMLVEQINFGFFISTSSLSARWKMDEGSGSTITDLSENNNTGTLIGTPKPSWLSGGEYGLQFTNVSGSVVTIPDNNSLDLLDNLTIAFYFKSDNISQTNRWILNKTNTAGTDSAYGIRYGYGGSIIRFYETGITYGFPYNHSSIAINDTNWHHIAYTYNGTTWTAYLDGISVGTHTVSTLLEQSNAQLVVGSFSATYPTTLEGAIRNLGIWKRALTSEEINELVNEDITNDKVYFSVAKTINETIIATDNIIKNISRVFVESVSVIDILNKTLSKVFFEVITIVDTLFRILGKTFNETIQIIDIIIRETAKIFYETVNIIDYILKMTSLKFSETLDIIDTFIKNIMLELIVSLNINDIFLKKISRTFLETVNIIDIFKKRLFTKVKKGITLLFSKGVQEKNMLKSKDEDTIV